VTEDRILRKERMLEPNSSAEKLHVLNVVDPKNDIFLSERKRRIKPHCEPIAVLKSGFSCRF